MSWCEKKFSDFFAKWKKGDLFLKSGEGCFGEVESLEFGEKFEDSIVKFICYEKSNQHQTIPLTQVRHFHAQNGPILNVGKYVKIVKLEETSYLSVVDGGECETKEKGDNAPADSLAVSGTTPTGEKKVICMAFGLEFYTTEKRAKILQRDIKRILFSNLEGVPVLSIDDMAPVDLTPTFSRWCSKLWHKLRFVRGQRKGSHALHRKLPDNVKTIEEQREKVKS